MPDKQLGAKQAQAQDVENAGPVLFSNNFVSPVPIEDFDPVGKPVVDLLKHLEKTQGLDWKEKTIKIQRNGEQTRVDESAIVRPGDYVMIAKAMKNN